MFFSWFFEVLIRKVETLSTNKKSKKTPQEKKGIPQSKKENPKAFENIIKDFEKIEGLFTIYRNVEKNEIYMELTPNQFENIYMINIKENILNL